MTLFVHPSSAIVAGADLAPRISGLMDRGHEIAQHTHFYEWREGVQPPPGKPASDLSVENVRRCLERDRSYLRAAGAEPVGFTSGVGDCSRGRSVARSIRVRLRLQRPGLRAPICQRPRRLLGGWTAPASTTGSLGSHDRLASRSTECSADSPAHDSARAGFPVRPRVHPRLRPCTAISSRRCSGAAPGVAAGTMADG